jgi:hypothetical protein
MGRGGGADSFAASSEYRLTITGGTVVVDAEGDGLDSAGTGEMTSGTVVVNGPTQDGNGALDLDGSLDVSGGVLLAAGSAGMAQAPATSSAQGWVAATLDSGVSAGTTVQVVDADGNVVATYTAVKDVASLVYTSPDVERGAGYTVVTGAPRPGTRWAAWPSAVTRPARPRWPP